MDQNNPSQKSKMPRLIIVVFALVLIISTINLVNDLSTLSLKPFGVFDTIFASLSRTAPNTGTIAKTLRGVEPIVDSYDRCVIVDPNGENKTVEEVSKEASYLILNDNFSGLNFAINLDGDADANTTEYDSARVKRAIDFADEMGMSYNVAVATNYNWETIRNVVQFVEDNYTRNVMPIITLCGPGNCEFRNKDDIVTFYQSVDLLSPYRLVAVLGPTEPGMGSPMNMENFFDNFPGKEDGYNELISMSNQAALELHDNRVQDSGSLFLAPAVFNLTNLDNDDVYEYLYNKERSENILPFRFDYMLGVSYTNYVIPGVGTAAYDFYVNGADVEGPHPGLRKFVSENDLKVILTNFGIIDGGGRPPRQEQIEEAKRSYQAYCEDNTTAGVLFNNSALYDAGVPVDQSVNDTHKLTKDEHRHIIADCKTDDTFRDFAWPNCNFDSCIYDKEFTSQSTAKMCGSEDEPETPKGAGLRVACAGQYCYTESIGTVEVSMPIKQFGSNSASGTPGRTYTPICVDVAKYNGSTGEDAYNQFAGKLTSSAGDYPMPWLGSAINCSSELILANPIFIDDLVQMDPNPGSSDYDEFKDPAEQKFAQDGDPDESYTAFLDKILDERAICRSDDTSDYCLDKTNNSIDIELWRRYLPFNTPSEYRDMACRPYGDAGAKYVVDPTNYIIGPELEIQERKKEWEGSGGDICIAYVNRNSTRKDTKILIDPEARLNCEIKQETIAVEPFCANIAASCTPQLMEAGTCSLSPVYNYCFTYNASPSDKVYVVTDKYPDAPTYDMPGVYDSLYRMYELIQRQMASKDPKLKIVFRENIGWKVDVSTKLRDPNNNLNDPDYTYNYGQDLNMCTVPEKLFKDPYKLGINDPVKTEYQYFHWLGYLDILQEINAAYINNPALPGARIEENPLFGEVGLVTSDKEFLLISDAAEKALSFPLLTCDEVEIAIALGTLPDKPYTCITTVDDTRYRDELAVFLCNRGYKTAECGDEMMCKVDDKVEVNNRQLSNPSCPLSGSLTCQQGPYGNASHFCANTGEVAFDLNGSNSFIVAPEDGTVVGVLGWNQEDQSGGNRCFNVPGQPDYSDAAVTDEIVSRTLGKYGPEDPSKRGQPWSGETVYESRQEIIDVINANGGVRSMNVVSTGGSILFKGNSGIYYRFVHTDISAAEGNSLVGKTFTGGDFINNGSRNIGIYKKPIKLAVPCWGVQHMHFESTAFDFVNEDGLEQSGSLIDPYTFVGDVLGCGEVVNNCGNDLKCEVQDIGDIMPDYEEAVCYDLDEDESSKEYDNLFTLIEEIANAYGNDDLKYLFAATLSKEGTGDFEDSIGPGNIENGIATEKAKYSGDPYDKGYETPNSASAKGPMQITCSMHLAFGYAPGTFNDLGCGEPVVGIGGLYDAVQKCTEAIGMKYGYGDKIDSTTVGGAICEGGSLLIRNMGDAQNTKGINPLQFNSGNPIWRTARSYLCGGSFCPAGDGYANETWRRYLVLQQNWDKFVSGEYGMGDLRRLSKTVVPEKPENDTNRNITED